MRNLLQQRISSNFSELDRNPTIPYFNTVSSGFFLQPTEIEQASLFRYEAHELIRLGVHGLTESMTGDELDAVTAALVGRWFVLGRGELLGGRNGILLPRSDQKSEE